MNMTRKTTKKIVRIQIVMNKLLFMKKLKIVNSNKLIKTKSNKLKLLKQRI